MLRLDMAADYDGSATDWRVATSEDDLLFFYQGGSRILMLTYQGSAVIGSAALATTATDGFLYIPSCAGAPTGVPTTMTGRSPIIHDTTNNRIYLYEMVSASQVHTLTSKAAM